MLTLFPPIVLLLLSMATGLVNGCMRNSFSKNHARTQADLSAFTLISLALSLVLLVLLSENFTFSPFTVGLGVVFGALTFAGALFGMKALSCGPMALTSILCSAVAMMIPALSGALFWQEQITLLRWIGMGLMLVMLPLTVKGDNGKPISWQWMLFCGLSCLSSGLIGILQKIHQTSSYAKELDGFLLVAFAFSVICNGVYLWIHCRKTPVTCSFSPRHRIFWMAVLVAVGIAIPNQFNLYLSGVMDSAVFFPLVNGGGLLLSLLAAIVLFKERPTRRQLLGMVIGFTAMMLLGMG